MSYLTTGIDYLGAQIFDGGRIERYSTSHTDRVIQLYISGELYAWAEPDGGVVEFHILDTDPADLIFPLAVDRDNSDTDYWSDAFPEAAAWGNKIKMRVPCFARYGAGDIIKFYRGDAGDGSATILIREQPMHPGGRRAVGYGRNYGTGVYGRDRRQSKGYGYSYGFQYGFGCEVIEYITEALPPGVYPVKATVEDEHGNVSSETTDTVTLDTYARPASALTVESYTQATDALELSWTESPDIP